MNRREFTYAFTGTGALLTDFASAHAAQTPAQDQAAPAAQPTGETPAYREPKLDIGRVADLLQRMTLEEKVDQISAGFRYEGVVHPTGRFNDINFRQALSFMYEPGFNANSRPPN